ncbi:hypothetical protein [Castellaniella caeni]|uniref:hypothetical protein n=1 Tax=Castellaniella caeni TaxID=266123 RepID=UPI000C9F2CEC|nr:hypothetical protein [Castellaniella caeni]
MSKIVEIGPLQSLRHDHIERIKKEASLGTYPYARLVNAAFQRLEHAERRELAEHRAEVERAARQRF